MTYHCKSEKKFLILVVDDEVGVTESVTDVLLDEGYLVDSCETGKCAETLIKKKCYDCILLDIMLPDTNGVVLAKKIKTEFYLNTSVPIILISARTTEEDKIHGLEYADDYMTKPFSLYELIARIQVMLRTHCLQNKLFVSKERYRLLYENIPEMCVTIDKDLVLSDCNTMFCEMLGKDKDSLTGILFTNFFRSDDAGIIRLFLASLKDGETEEFERIFTINGSDNCLESILVNLRAVRLKCSDDDLFITVVMKDVTLNVKLEEQQRIARQHLYRSAKLASIGTLASGIAHEINNPLAVILGFSDAILHRFECDEEIEKHELAQYLSIIKKETLRCRDVVENLSKFSCDYESSMENVSLYECIQSALVLMRSVANKKNITIENDISHNVIVNTDEHKIGQVFVNVIKNALDFCTNGCCIKITMGKQDDKIVRLVVNDNGPGMSGEVLQKVFDPFFTTKEVGKGIGLGLSVSYKLMEECGGTIDLQSRDGHGTEVTLEIPCS